ncbi:hypothetical protein [uncultured Massilia sp.]|uniref:hypothetical protein n=1 Tax=uncultured Massilia sp. TaxID=169973 RepID=UPI0025CD4C06|nr:hypothetical protein [uncultured Massilia sp.]
MNAEQTAFDAARLQVAGLNRRLEVARQAEAAAKQALADIEVEWLREEMRITDEAYTKQAHEIYQSYLRIAACVNALKSHGVAASHFSTSEELAIPAIGPVSCDAAWHKRGGQSGHGKLLIDAHRLNFNQTANDDVKRDLEQAKSVSKTSKPSRFAKVVAGLIPGTQE